MQKINGIFFPRSDVEFSVPFAQLGDYRPKARNFALELCIRFRRAVEVGAHVGLHTRHFAEIFASVEAFEPQPQAYRCLTANVEADGVRTYRIALGREVGTGYIPAMLGKSSGAASLQSKRAPESLPVPVRVLDDYEWRDVDLLKIAPLSGAEDILAGSMETIRASLPVIWLSKLASGVATIECMLTLGRLGYTIAGQSGGETICAVSGRPATRAASAPVTRLRVNSNDNRLIWEASPVSAPPEGSPTLLGGVASMLERRDIISDRGRAALLAVNLPVAAAPEEVQSLVMGATRRPFVVRDITDVNLDDLVQERLTCRFADGGLVITLPPECLIPWREVVVTVEAASGPRVIFRRDLRQIGNLDKIEVRLPPSMVRIPPIRASVHLLGEAGPKSMSFDVAADPAKLSPELLNFYLNRGGGGNPVIGAFAKAVRGRMSYAEDGFAEGIPVVWGVLRGSKEIVDQSVSSSGFFYFIDHAYFGRGHFKNYRITRNGFEAGAVRRCPPDRINALGVQAAPWNRGGEYVLVCPPTEHFMRAHNCGAWLDDTLAELTRHTDRKIVVRRKPKPDETVVPLEDALRGAHALVTHSSNIAVEAVVAGTPVFVAPSSAAAPMGLTNLSQIESPVFPDRDPWLAHLAYSQFSFDELGTGQAWRMLLEWEEREFF